MIGLACHESSFFSHPLFFFAADTVMADSEARRRVKRGKIRLVLGPMFSGKTSEILRCLRRHRIAGRKTVMIAHASDQERSGCLGVTTHDGVHDNGSIMCERLADVEAMPRVADADVIGIDEGQFFPDLVEQSQLWSDDGKDVHIAALSGRHDGRPWPVVSAIIPRCEKIKHLTAVCHRCNADGAAFSLLKTHETGERIIGGADKYDAACRDCMRADEIAKGGAAR